VAPDAAVVLAVPAWVAGDLVPGLTVPDDHRAIVNAHFAIAPPKGAPEMLGLINATSEWLFTHPDRVSVTISAADRLVDTRARRWPAPSGPRWRRLWACLQTPPAAMADRQGKARHLCRHPAQERLRPKQRTAFTNLFLAGDWVDTGLPATIEGALRSGDRRRVWSWGSDWSMGAGDDDPQDDTNADTLTRNALDEGIARGANRLGHEQQGDGHWVYELEADCTIPSEYILLRHYLGEPDDLVLEAKIGTYLRRIQSSVHDGWALYHDGGFDISATIKAYYALKMIGDDVDAPHMARARAAVLKAGGAERANVFTKIQLALFGAGSWQVVPTIPPELILAPKWFPVHLLKMSYWARTVVVPLLVLCALRPLAKNKRGIKVDELYSGNPAGLTSQAAHVHRVWKTGFEVLDWGLKRFENHWPKKMRRRAIDLCAAWVTERLNGEDGLGAIYPAMANSVMMYDVLGYAEDHPHRAIARHSVEKLLVIKDDEAYCQPCVSPVWDTALAAHAMLEVGTPKAVEQAHAALDWLGERQILDTVGDWAEQRPDVRPGGWAFQYGNDYYPDLDDTAVVVMAMDRAAGVRGGKDAQAIARGAEWTLGLQSHDGGFGASTPIMTSSTSTICPLPIMARCSIRPRRMCRRVWSRCWRRWASWTARA
jgi:squalene/oxidosqualene cyclase-like protein